MARRFRVSLDGTHYVAAQGNYLDSSRLPLETGLIGQRNHRAICESTPGRLLQGLPLATLRKDSHYLKRKNAVTSGGFDSMENLYSDSSLLCSRSQSDNSLIPFECRYFNLPRRLGWYSLHHYL